MEAIELALRLRDRRLSFLEVPPRLLELRLEGQRPPKVGGGLGGPAAAQVDQSEVVVRLGVIGPLPQRLFPFAPSAIGG